MNNRKDGKIKILPAVLEKNSAEAWRKIELFDSIAPEIQLDVLDGKLIDKISYPYSGLSLKERFGLFRSLKSSELEIHLMLEENMDFIDRFPALLNLAKRVVLQIESRDAESALKTLKNKGLMVGASIMMETEIELLSDYMELLDYVQFMSISKIGVQGSSFDPRVLNRIRKFGQKYPTMELAADGGVSPDNMQLLLEAGVRRLAVGSAIFKTEDPVATWKDMSEFLTASK